MQEMIGHRGIGFYLKIYFKIAAQDIKSKMSYRSDFIISMIGMIATNILGFVSFYIMFTKFPSVNGWNYYEMLFLYGFTLIAITPTQCLFDNNWSLRMYVIEGDFIKYCFRPINLFFYYYSEIFDVKGLGQFAFGIGTLIYAWAKLGIAVTVTGVLKLIFLAVTASMVYVGMQTIAACTCFFIPNSFFVLDMSLKLRDYAKYPITIFGPVFKFLFTFILPVAFIAYYPSMFILRPDDLPLLAWFSPLMGVLFFYLGYKMFMFGTRKYDGSGS